LSRIRLKKDYKAKKEIYKAEVADSNKLIGEAAEVSKTNKTMAGVKAGEASAKIDSAAKHAQELSEMEKQLHIKHKSKPKK